MDPININRCSTSRAVENISCKALPKNEKVILIVLLTMKAKKSNLNQLIKKHQRLHILGLIKRTNRFLE